MSMIRMVIHEFYRHPLFGQLAQFYGWALTSCRQGDSPESRFILCLLGHQSAIEDDAYSEMQYHRGREVIANAGSPVYHAAVAVFMAIRYSRGDTVADYLESEPPIFPHVAIHVVMHTNCRFARLVCLAAINCETLSPEYWGDITLKEVNEVRAWLRTMPGRSASAPRLDPIEAEPQDR